MMTREALFLALIACGTQGTTPSRPDTMLEDVAITTEERDPAFFSIRPNPVIVRELGECKAETKRLEETNLNLTRALANPCYQPPRSPLYSNYTECKPGWACFEPTEAGALIVDLLRLKAIDACERERKPRRR